MPESAASPIREARLKKKLTQVELAKRVGVDNSAISGYETAAFRPDPDIAIKIANVLGTTLDKIYGRVA